MCLLLPVNSVFIIKDNIIPKELRHDRNCRGGLVLSKFKPDEYVNMSCANIRFQQSDKQNFVFKTTYGKDINSATTKQTEYLAVYEDGICNMKAVELQDTYNGVSHADIPSDIKTTELLNSYGYCGGDFNRDTDSFNRDEPVTVNSRSCEHYGYRSSYSANECSLLGGQNITHDNTVRLPRSPWGCIQLPDGRMQFNMATEFDVSPEDKHDSYTHRNDEYFKSLMSRELSDLVSSFYSLNDQMRYIEKSVRLEINEYAPPTEPGQLTYLKSKYTQFIEDLPPIYMPYPTGREDDWRIEYNEIYFTEKFITHYINMTERFGAEYHIEEVEYRIMIQLFRETVIRIGVLKNADVIMRGLFESLKTFMHMIEDRFYTVEHMHRWWTHLGVPPFRDMVREKVTVDFCKYLVDEAHSMTLSNSERIKILLDGLSYESMANSLENQKNYIKDILSQAYVSLSNEKYKPVDLEKRVLQYPDEVRLVFGRIINGVYAIPSDWESDPRYIRYENAIDSNWKNTYVPSSIAVRLAVDPLRTNFFIDGTAVEVDLDTTVDDLLRYYEPFYTDVDSSFEVLPVQKYSYGSKQRSIKTYIPETVGVPTITVDRYQSRLNIIQEMVNLENHMVEYNYHDNTELMALHDLYVKQPPLCGVSDLYVDYPEYNCQCVKTEPNRATAVSGCADVCNGPFRHFWDQSEPRLESKTLVHDRSECICMTSALTELQCVLQGRQWINELFVSQYDMVSPIETDLRDSVYEDTYLYCKMMDCVNGTVGEPCLYSGGVCEKGWFDGNCNAVDACDGFAYEDCICGSSTCKAGKYCTQAGVCENIVPNDDKKLLYMYNINNV